MQVGIEAHHVHAQIKDFVDKKLKQKEEEVYIVRSAWKYEWIMWLQNSRKVEDWCDCMTIHIWFPNVENPIRTGKTLLGRFTMLYGMRKWIVSYFHGKSRKTNHIIVF